MNKFWCKRGSCLGVWAGDYFLMKLHLQIVNFLNNKWTISDVREARVWEGNGEGVNKINKLLIC